MLRHDTDRYSNQHRHSNGFLRRDYDCFINDHIVCCYQHGAFNNDLPDNRGDC